MKYSTNTLANFIFPITLLIIASGIIFYQFPAIPQNVALDEVEFIRIAKGLENIPYTPYTTLATGHATMYFYLLLACINLFGETTFAVRLPSAVFGVLNTFLVYLIAQQVVRRHKKLPSELKIALPFFAAFVFATMRWYFNFARFGFEATTVLFIELVGVYFFFLYKEYKKLWYLVLVGLAAGLAYNSYTPGRIFFLLPAFFVFFEFGIRQKITFSTLKKLTYIIVPFIILTIPLNLYFKGNTDTRIYQLFYLQNEQLSISEKVDFTLQNIQKVSAQFLFQGDMNGRHNYPGKPMLNPVQGLFMVIGIGIALIRWRDFYNRFFLVYFLIGIIPPLLTYPWENPNALRSVTVLPSIAYFMMLPILQLIKIPLPKRLILLGVFFLFALSAIYELRTYFVFQTTVFPEAFELNKNFIQPYLEGNYFLDPNRPRPEL